MNVRARKPTTHPSCRSLLQKAVRRGHADVVEAAAEHLISIGDRSWFQMRVSVIVAEECWPLAIDLAGCSSSADQIKALCRAADSVKSKDAAGLGSLGYLFSQGETSVLEGKRDRPIRIVAAGLQRPNDFWMWVRSECTTPDQQTVVNAMHQAFRRGGWPWDRAFMIATAYLAASAGIPPVDIAPKTTGEMPLWVAIDKHTPEGKQAISAAARELGIPVRHAAWLSFYFESALVNQIVASPWWEREVQWRLKKIGITYADAERGWAQLRPIIRSHLAESVTLLQKHLVRSKPAEQTVLI